MFLAQSIYKDVVMEPQLQQLSGESFKYKSANKDEEARSDLQIPGFWFQQRRASTSRRFRRSPEVTKQEPFKVLHNAREEEEA